MKTLTNKQYETLMVKSRAFDALCCSLETDYVHEGYRQSEIAMIIDNAVKAMGFKTHFDEGFVQTYQPTPDYIPRYKGFRLPEGWNEKPDENEAK